MGPKSKDCKKERDTETQRHRDTGRRPCVDKGRDGGMSYKPRNHQQLEEQEGSSPEP